MNLAARLIMFPPGWCVSVCQ